VIVALTVAVLAIAGVIVVRWGWGNRPESASLSHPTFTQLTDQPGREVYPSLSPDGKLFVYASPTSGNWDIYLQRVGGSNPINLTQKSSRDETNPVFSPDGEQIVFVSDREGGGIFLMGATGESVRRLIDSGYDPAWSPDGKEIVMSTELIDGSSRGSGIGQLWAVNIATGQNRLIANGGTDAVQPHWSPHGHRIAYWGLRTGGQRDIWTIPAGGGEPVAVTNDLFVDWNPVWSPDGKFLYFISDRSGNMNVWRVPTEEQTGEALGPPEAVTTPSPNSMYISFSRDARHIAYVQVTSRISIMKASFDPVTGTVVGQPTWITQGTKRAHDPVVSPDGEWVAFQSVEGNQEDIFVIRQDGTDRRQLTDDLYKDRAPRWSPDGRRIVFYSDRSGHYELWTMNLDGSALQQLTHASGPAVTRPVWSPDGTQIAYHQEGGPFIMDLGKPWKEQVLQAVPPISGSQSSITVWSWSPDGRALAGWQEGKDVGIFLYWLALGQYEQISQFGGWPVWMSDHRRLLFTDYGKLYVVDSRSKRVREIFSLAAHTIGRCALSGDDRLLCLNVAEEGSDIWLMELK
jgi:Tol biopolymer transport system component